MALEIERKFLVTGDAWRILARGVTYRQGHLCRTGTCTVRIRIAGERAFLTVKSRTSGITRAEYEYEIPLADGEELLANLAERPIIKKTRRKIPYAGFIWDVDEFHGENQGLILAEIELEHEDQPFDKPAWIGEEVTGDPRYGNAALARRPFSAWRAGTPTDA